MTQRILRPLRRALTSYRTAKRKAALLQNSAFLKCLPAKPVYLDVGARDGFSEAWTALTHTELIQGVAVELDAIECERLKTQDPTIICLPVALGPKIEKRRLYITRAPSCTSFFEPNFEVLCDYDVRAYFDVTRTVELDVVTYESLTAKGEAPPPTFMKLDVQGFEREVLKGMGALIDGVLAIEMEGHFRPLYHGQWTAFEMIEEMRVLGFILRDIRQQGPFEGEFAEGNFYFSRMPKKLDAGHLALLRVWEDVERIQPPPPYEPIRKDVLSTMILHHLA